VTRTFRDGHAETWWAADAGLVGTGRLDPPGGGHRRSGNPAGQGHLVPTSRINKLPLVRAGETGRSACRWKLQKAPTRLPPDPAHRRDQPARPARPAPDLPASSPPATAGHAAGRCRPHHRHPPSSTRPPCGRCPRREPPTSAPPAATSASSANRLAPARHASGSAWMTWPCSPPTPPILPLLRAVITQHQQVIRLGAGQRLLVSNTRWLHGRDRYTGPRVMLRLLGDPLPGTGIQPGFPLPRPARAQRRQRDKRSGRGRVCAGRDRRRAACPAPQVYLAPSFPAPPAARAVAHACSGRSSQGRHAGCAPVTHFPCTRTPGRRRA
jgi:hypothetical protein